MPYVESPIGGAMAMRLFGCKVSRSTSRIDCRSKRKLSAELDPTPSFTWFQSSPLVLSTMAHASRFTLPPLSSITR